MNKKNKNIVIFFASIFFFIIIILISGLMLTSCIGCNDNKHTTLDLTDQQLTNEIEQTITSEDTKLSIYPHSEKLIIECGEEDAIGFGIRNLLKDTSNIPLFSYNISVVDTTCKDKSTEYLLDYIIAGRSQIDIPIDSLDIYSTKIIFEIPSEAPLCSTKYQISVKTDNGESGEIYTYKNIKFIIETIK